MANLVELFDNIVQMQALNGVPLANGKLYVYALGRTRLMDTWSDVDGESLNTNPIILDDAGQAHVYVSDDFDYTLVVCDAYDNEVFSIDKYLYSKGEHSHADVAVAPSEHIGVSSYHVGETTVYVPYITGELGKTYHGIEPIVVNNQENKISARNIPLGVQEPLYFVEDSESACIIGASGVASESDLNSLSATVNNKLDTTAFSTVSGDFLTAHQSLSGYATTGDVAELAETISENYQPKGDYATHDDLSGFMEESKLETADGKITGYDGTAFAAGSVNPSEFIPWSASGEFQSAGNYATTDDLTAYQEKGDYYSASNPSGFINSDAISAMATTGFVADVSADITAMIPTALTGDYLTKDSADTLYQPIGSYLSSNALEGYATENWVTSQGYITTETDWTDTITAASANAYNEATAAIPTGLATTDDLQTVSGEITAMIPSTAGLATESFVTSQGYITNDAITGKQDITGMTAYATVESLTAKQDSGDYLSASDSANFLLTSDSGNFYPMNENPSGYLTTHQSLADYQLTADMVNYQTTAAMTAYQPIGDYLTTADSANFYTTANESGYISEVPATYLQNTDLTISEGKITEISGVPLSAGDELPSAVSAAADYVTATSANIDSTIDNVSSNSGAWGGSALPISAGPGIKFEMVDNTLVASTDETILYSATPKTYGGTSSGETIQLNETIANFEKLRFYVNAIIKTNNNVNTTYYEVREIDNFSGTAADFQYGPFPENNVTANWFVLRAHIDNSTCDVSAAYNSYTAVQQPNWANKWFPGSLYKVVGVNRIIGSN